MMTCNLTTAQHIELNKKTMETCERYKCGNCKCIPEMFLLECEIDKLLQFCHDRNKEDNKSE